MDDYADPITIWTESSTIAPSDLIFYEHPSIPEWEGRFLITVLKDKHLRAVKVDDTDGDQVLEDIVYLNNVFGRLRDICTAPDGRVFLATNGPAWSNTQPNTHKIVELKNSAYVPVGMNEVNNAHLRVYPNPASAVINVGLPADWVGGALQVADCTGRILHTEAIAHNVSVLDLQHCANGIYLLSAVKDGRSMVQRIVVNR